MKRNLIIVIGLCLSIFPMWLYGQEANYGQIRKFIQLRGNSTVLQPNFLKGSDKFWFKFETDEGIRYYFVDTEAKKKRLLFEPEKMSALLSETIHLAIDSKNLDLGTIRFKDDQKTMCFNYKGHNFEYNIETESLTSGQEEVRKAYRSSKYPYGTYSPDSAYVIYARRHNLCLLRLSDSVETVLTTDGVRYCSYSSQESDTSAQNVQTSARWFKDSKKFYMLRVDNRKVAEGHLMGFLGPRPSVSAFKYALPGDQYVPQFDLFVFDAATGEKQRIAIDEWKDQAISVVHLPKHSEYFYVMRKKRTCDEIDICRAYTVDGRVEVLIHEECKPYFNEDLFYLAFLNEEQDIIWRSERTGWGHYYHYDGNGNLKNAITSGSWVAGKIVKMDTLNRNLYFEAYGKNAGGNPYYAQLCKASFDRDEVKQLTNEEANHQVYLSPRRNYIVDCYSRVDLEPKFVLRSPSGKVLMELAHPDLKRVYATGWRMPEAFTVKAADGKTDLYGVMWKPFDFDSTRRYPIISHVYPGPQTESFPLDFAIGGEESNLAQLGFVVVCFGHRGGSPVRSKAYHTFGHGNLRDYALADDKYGIEQLAQRYSFIDLSRVGIYGHSGGGFMATAAICTYPDFYKAAVSSAGNHDNHIFNQWWGETHHGLKVEKRMVGEGDNRHEEEFYTFKVPTNMELAKNLKGHLMLVTGDSDFIVHPANTIRMVDALIKANKNFELVILPGETHWYSRQTAMYYQKKLQLHFAKYLLGDFSSEESSNMNF